TAYTHSTVQVARVEWDLSHVLEAQRDHAGHPAEQNLVARLEDASWVVPLQIRRLVRPPERAERPEPRREPRVEHVGILIDVVAAAARAARRIRRVLVRDDHVVAVPAVPRRDGVAPPDLTRYRPVADVLHPVEVDLLLVLRDEGDAAVADRRDRRWREPVHAHPPLLQHQRLIDGPAAIVDRDR